MSQGISLPWDDSGIQTSSILTPQFQGREESMENLYPLLSTLDQKCDTCHFCSQPIDQKQSHGPNLIPGRLGNAGEHVEYLVSTIVSDIVKSFLFSVQKVENIKFWLFFNVSLYLSPCIQKTKISFVNFFAIIEIKV